MENSEVRLIGSDAQKCLTDGDTADAFHFNQETGRVKLINFGSGVRSFEHGLTTSGWSLLSREVGVMTKLQFIAPEVRYSLPRIEHMHGQISEIADGVNWNSKLDACPLSLTVGLISTAW